MKTKRISPAAFALMAALLFGASAPLSKLLLADIQPVTLAGLLYLGCGIGVLIFRSLNNWQKPGPTEAPIRKKDAPWLVAAITAGGILAPILLLLGLDRTPAATASLLLSFEGVATAVIAFAIFKEAMGRRAGLAVVVMTIASILLSWTTGSYIGISLGALAVIGATVLWGFENNFTRHISACDPLLIVMIKGLVAGSFNLLFSRALGESWPELSTALLAMLLGSLSYGASIALYILALRGMGAARTSTLFGTAPFAGAVLSLALLGERPEGFFVPAFLAMLVGAWLLLSEEHGHIHVHAPLCHDHNHAHDDEHHQHDHATDDFISEGAHTHQHTHDCIEHVHKHAPDIHHRHEHASQ
jgi:drug/metabolite transporter (DMT)-like permease